MRTHQSFGVNLFKWHHWTGAQSTSSKMLQWPAAAATGAAAMTMTTMLASASVVERRPRVNGGSAAHRGAEFNGQLVKLEEGHLVPWNRVCV